MNLPFRFEKLGGRLLKIRDDGRRGWAIGDEALLWDVLQEALSVMKQQAEELEALRANQARQDNEMLAAAATATADSACHEAELMESPKPHKRGRQ